MTTMRRNGGIFKVVLSVVVFFVCVYLVYIYNDVSGQLKDTERTAERYRREQETVSAQLQDLTAVQDNLKRTCNNENQQFTNRLSALKQQYNMLKTQHEDRESEYVRLRDTFDKDQEDHQQLNNQRNDEYNTFKQEKALEVSSLKDMVANLEREKEQLTNNLLNFKQQLQDTVDKVNLDQQTIDALQQEMANQKHQLGNTEFTLQNVELQLYQAKHQLDMGQAGMQSLQMELYQAKNLNQQQAAALKNQQQQLASQQNAQQLGAQQNSQQLAQQLGAQQNAQQLAQQLGVQQNAQQLVAQQNGQHFAAHEGIQQLGSLQGVQQLPAQQGGQHHSQGGLNPNVANAQQIHLQEGLKQEALQGMNVQQGFNQPIQQGAQLGGAQPRYGIDKQLEGMLSKKNVQNLFNLGNKLTGSDEAEKKNALEAVVREQEQRQIAPPRGANVKDEENHLGSQKNEGGQKQSHKMNLPNVPYIDDGEASEYKKDVAEQRIENQGPVNLQVQKPVFHAAGAAAADEPRRGPDELMFQPQHPNDLLQQLQPHEGADDSVKHEQIPPPGPQQDENAPVDSEDPLKEEDKDDEENYDDEYDKEDNDDEDNY